jgi:hypothetical protein
MVTDQLIVEDKAERTTLHLYRADDYMAVEMKFPGGYVRMRISGEHAPAFAKRAAEIASDLQGKK